MLRVEHMTWRNLTLQNIPWRSIHSGNARSAMIMQLTYLSLIYSLPWSHPPSHPPATYSSILCWYISLVISRRRIAFRTAHTKVLKVRMTSTLKTEEFARERGDSNCRGRSLMCDGLYFVRNLQGASLQWGKLQRQNYGPCYWIKKNGTVVHTT